jgi:hypothetical protein
VETFYFVLNIIGVLIHSIPFIIGNGNWSNEAEALKSCQGVNLDNLAKFVMGETKSANFD